MNNVRHLGAVAAIAFALVACTSSSPPAAPHAPTNPALGATTVVCATSEYASVHAWEEANADLLRRPATRSPVADVETEATNVDELDEVAACFANPNGRPCPKSAPAAACTGSADGNRREVRGARLLEAWLRDFDSDKPRVSAVPSPVTERDGAWAARALARVTQDAIRAFVEESGITDRCRASSVAYVLEARRERILARYLTTLSPIADLRLEGTHLCGVDLAWREWVGEESDYRYSAGIHMPSGAELPLTVAQEANARVCVTLPHVAADDSASRHFVVRITNGIARGPLVADVDDLGPSNGFRLVGLRRPESP
jgi:hypothetical protein